jgi:VPDSG-CTERM motif
MNFRLTLILIVTIFIALATESRAISFTFQEKGSNLDLGPTATFTEGGVSITASAFFTFGGTTDLYAKSVSTIGGSSEMGLGTTADPTGDHEITTWDFIQLTLPTTPASNVQQVLLASVQSNESALVYFTHTPGTLAGATLIGTIANADGSINIPGGDQNGYIDIRAGKANVLLQGLVLTVPDTGTTLSLLGISLGGIALLRRTLA